MRELVPPVARAVFPNRPKERTISHNPGPVAKDAVFLYFLQFVIFLTGLVPRVIDGFTHLVRFLARAPEEVLLSRSPRLLSETVSVGSHLSFAG